SSIKRSRALPEVSTLAESGLPGFDVTGWYGVIAPAGTPGAIVSKLQVDIAAVLQAPDTGAKLIAEGAEPVGSTTEAFAKFLQRETQKWAQVVKTAGIRLD
ncbi:MAG TPA: tripartite tricarboxylate transporter substrate-binding protein, partial [Burkholderiales bacterium]|nr:tripartite tricarboxylate transporter substrate-binding protein [Burkholderiales bacterium]